MPDIDARRSTVSVKSADGGMTTTSESEDDVGRYVVARGARYVAPYVKTFNVRVTRRRAGALADVLANQVGTWRGFASPGDEHWRRELAQGRVRVLFDALRKYPNGGAVKEEDWASGTGVDLRASCAAGDVIEVTRHVHEPAIAGHDVGVTYECSSSGIVVIEKPAGVPALAGVGAGWEGYNNARRLASRALLRARAGKKRASSEGECDERDSGEAWASANGADADDRVWAAHRVDAPVSGIWLCARSAKQAGKATRAMMKGSREKIYLARVTGALETPAEGMLIDAPLKVNAKTSLAEVVPESEGGKSCATRVFALKIIPGTNDEPTTTLVVVRLERQGRYHQIRAHLSHSGFPISHDRAYDPRARPRYAGLAYDDDEHGSLIRVLRAAAVDWCPECAEALRLTADVRREDKLVALDRYGVGASIDLHAAKYAFASGDVNVDVISSALPSWFPSDAFPGARDVADVLARVRDAEREPSFSSKP